MDKQKDKNKTEEKQTSKRFCETCPRRIVFFPKRACSWALNKINGERDLDTCEWYIVDAKSHFCFWVYMSEKNNQNSKTLQQIATLTGTSINNIKLAETSAMKRFASRIGRIGKAGRIDLFSSLVKNRSLVSNNEAIREFVKEINT